MPLLYKALLVHPIYEKQMKHKSELQINPQGDDVVVQEDTEW